MQTARTDASTAITRQFAIEAARLLADRRCEDIRLLDVRGLSQVCDFLLVGSGTSERQMRSLAHEIGEEAQQRDVRVFRQNADTSNTWVVIDFVDLVVHLFEPELRLYYDLESMWDKAEPLDWRRDDQRQAHRFRGEIGVRLETGDQELGGTRHSEVQGTRDWAHGE